MLIISYEMLIRAISDLEKISFDLIICDEAHRLKNTNIKTTQCVSGLRAFRRIALTGTPIQNDLSEFFAIVEFCNPGVLGSAGVFGRVFEQPIVQARQPAATPAEKKLGQQRGLYIYIYISLFLSLCEK